MHESWLVCLYFAFVVHGFGLSLLLPFLDEVGLSEFCAVFWNRVVLMSELWEMGAQHEISSQLLHQVLVLHYLFKFLVSHDVVSVTKIIFGWDVESIFEHWSCVWQHQDTGREWEILLGVFKVVNHFLILNQLSKSFDVRNTVFVNLPRWHICLITHDVCAFKNLKKPWFHLISVVILLRDKLHLTKGLNRQLYRELQR